MRIRFWAFTLRTWKLLGAALLLAFSAGLAQLGERYFPETGFTVVGPFLEVYQRALEPELIYGYPITAQIVDPFSGKTVQYFERGRFELDPEMPDGRVAITDLGTYLYVPGVPADLPSGLFNCRTLAGEFKKFKLCYEFLKFYKEHGGAAQFGQPVSNLEWQNGRLVQYFEHGRLEWHPESPTGQRIALGDLGKEYYQLFTGQPPAAAVAGLPALQTLVAASQPITGLQGEQTIVILVRDEKQQPVRGAEVATLIENPAGTPIDFREMVYTDENGRAEIEFPFVTSLPGQFTIQVHVRHNDLEDNAQTSFLAWY